MSAVSFRVINDTKTGSNAQAFSVLMANVTASNTVVQDGVTGSYTLTVSAHQQIQYSPFTTDQYVRNALASTPGSGGLAYGISVLQTLTELRNVDAGTASTNLNLRDAQYAVYGYNAGAILGTHPSLTNLALSMAAVPNAFGGPLAATYYEAEKFAAAQFGVNLPTNPGFPTSTADTRSLSSNISGYPHTWTQQISRTMCLAQWARILQVSSFRL